ncbi:carbohydrate ABC transporter permease [Cohnella sp. LGH]|uniref:carbohydrate ABC transporter permease n=1 Tax=Cohnella sp. LGH TaxID=1619153 RepID=UPI001AD9635F|nr:carbohydrate ABC transporter permease [Cohnella sp. LGH]QTH44247.1 carbohydrate ABC transporter permease [Cohnella sp. LGH]
MRYLSKLPQLLMFVVSLLWAVPLVWMLWTSIKPKSEALSTRFNFNFTFDNYIHVWQSAPFDRYLLNTLIIVASVFAVQLITVTMAAYAFARVNFIGKSLVFLVFLMQIMVPNDVLIFPNYLVVGEMGLIDTKLAIMLPFFASSFGVFLLRQAFMGIPKEYDEAATMEGYTKWQLLWKVYFPLGRPIYIAFGLVSVSYHWNNFLWPLIVTNSIENRPVTVGLAIFGLSQETGAQWSEVSAATLIVVLPLLLAFLLFQRQFMNSFMHSGIK